jgi:serine/threonine protein kinase
MPGDGLLDSQGEALACAPGELFAGYEVTAFLASGGTSQLFTARHQVMQREAVIKVQKASLRADPKRARRIVDEARALALIDHPNVVQIHHADIDERVGVFIVMERLSGRDLRSVLTALTAARRKVPVDETIALVKQIADAVGAFHRAGVLHRDLKPENVFVKVAPDGERKVKVLDLGIAKLPASKTTEEEVLTGTVSYMARERIVGERATERSDVFSLAVMLHEMLSGEHPFLPSGPGRLASIDALRRISNGNYVPLSACAPELPPALAQFVARAMARLPAERPASMADFVRELELAMRATPPVAAPPKAALTIKMTARELTAARASSAVVDLDATAPFGTRVPAFTAASQGTLAPIDPELARRASKLCPPLSARLTPLPSFACELASRLAIPSLVLVEARGAWRFMRVPLVVQAHTPSAGPPEVRIGEGSAIPIPTLPPLNVKLVSASAALVEGLPGATGPSSLSAYETFACGAYRFQLVPPTPDGLGIPFDYAACTVEQSATLSVPSLSVRAGAIDALTRRFPLRTGELLIGGLAGVDVPLFGCRVPVAARLSVRVGSVIELARCEGAEVRVQGSRGDALSPGDVLEVEGWTLELVGPELGLQKPR